MKINLPADGGLTLARVLLLGVLAATPISTSLAIGLEFAVYGTFLLAPEPRRRFVDVVRHPLVLGMLPFAAIIVIATFYGPASWDDALRALFAWRRMLMLPLAAAVFVDFPSKRLVLKVLMVTCVAGLLVSFMTAATEFWITPRLAPGIVFHDYAVQGITFSLAATICVAALMRPADFAGDRLLGNRWAMAIILAMLVFDVMFILWGRTGFFAIVLMSAATVVFLVQGSWSRKGLAGVAVVVVGGLILLASPHVRIRVADGASEVATVDQAPEGTRFGVRVVLWRNTARMILDHPIFGVGTGGFQPAYATYVRGVAGWRGNETGDPHNQYLKFQGEQGIVGLAAFLFFIYCALRCPAPTPYRELAAAALIGWCATSIASADFSTHIEGRLIFFWLGAMLGGGVSSKRPQSGAEAFSPVSAALEQGSVPRPL